LLRRPRLYQSCSTVEEEEEEEDLAITTNLSMSFSFIASASLPMGLQAALGHGLQLLEF
jgi:hypothetical protein